MNCAAGRKVCHPDLDGWRSPCDQLGTEPLLLSGIAEQLPGEPDSQVLMFCLKHMVQMESTGVISSSLN